MTRDGYRVYTRRAREVRARQVPITGCQVPIDAAGRPAARAGYVLGDLNETSGHRKFDLDLDTHSQALYVAYHGDWLVGGT